MSVWGVRLFCLLFTREEWWLNVGGSISMRQCKITNSFLITHTRIECGTLWYRFKSQLANHLNGHTLLAVHFLYFRVYLRLGSVQRSTKQITLRILQSTRVVRRVCVPSWQNIYNVTRISKTNCTSSFNRRGYIVQILQGSETDFWNNSRMFRFRLKLEKFSHLPRFMGYLWEISAPLVPPII